MKLVALLVLVAVAAAYTDIEHKTMWQQFVAKYHKVYEPAEYYHRFRVFVDNVEKIHAHNQLGKSYTLGINEYADLTLDEFRAQKISGLLHHEVTNPVQLSTNDLPETVDWIEAGAVTKVKNQGQCGSCWAFSAIAAVEGTYQIQSQKTVQEFSEQQLVDCSKGEGNEGCNGGLMDYAFTYILKQGKLCSEKDYAYKARDQSCTVCKKPITVDFNNYTDVPENDGMQLKAAAAETVVAVAIEADQFSFQFYSGGVFDDESCGTQLDHGVAVVGYGTDEESGKMYWNVRNSWGSSWGLAGYIKILRTDSADPEEGICGINKAASYLAPK